MSDVFVNREESGLGRQRGLLQQDYYDTRGRYHRHSARGIIARRFDLFCFDRASLRIKWLWSSGENQEYGPCPSYWKGHYVVLCADTTTRKMTVAILDAATGQERA